MMKINKLDARTEARIDEVILATKQTNEITQLSLDCDVSALSLHR